MVIINKSDLLNAKTLDDVTREVGEQLRPSVKMVKASHGAVDPTVLLGLNAAAEDDLDSRPSHHDGVDDHDHDDFDSFSMDVVEGLSVDELLARLSRAITEHGVLRV